MPGKLVHNVVNRYQFTRSDIARRLVGELCWHQCPRCRGDWSHVVPDFRPLDRYSLVCQGCRKLKRVLTSLSRLA